MVSKKKLIVGLGNPGKQYADTRHNVGFMVVDNLARELGLTYKRRFMSGADTAESADLVLVKPYTYMNRSGDAVLKVKNKFSVAAGDIMIVYDDINLAFGNIRLRKQGTAGGHNGVSSVIQRLATADFPRIRYGIGSPDVKEELKDYVLGRFSQPEMQRLAEDIGSMTYILMQWRDGVEIDLLMSRVNKKG